MFDGKVENFELLHRLLMDGLQMCPGSYPGHEVRQGNIEFRKERDCENLTADQRIKLILQNFYRTDNDQLFYSCMHRWEFAPLFFTQSAMVQGRYVPYVTSPYVSSRTIRPRTLFSDIFKSPYVLSLKESQPTELHQPMNWLGIQPNLTA